MSARRSSCSSDEPLTMAGEGQLSDATPQDAPIRVSLEELDELAAVATCADTGGIVGSQEPPTRPPASPERSQLASSESRAKFRRRAARKRSRRDAGSFRRPLRGRSCQRARVMKRHRPAVKTRRDQHSPSLLAHSLPRAHRGRPRRWPRGALDAPDVRYCASRVCLQRSPAAVASSAAPRCSLTALATPPTRLLDLWPTMGISGLLPLLKDASRAAHVRDHKGKTFAVDGASPSLTFRADPSSVRLRPRCWR